MSRPARITLANFIYHIINRGNNSQAVFYDEEDFTKYLLLLERYKEKFSLKIYAYCLMSNHVHLLIQPTRPQTLSKFMQSITTAHTKLHHNKYKTAGHLWQGRFKNPVVQTDNYLIECLKYIECNPVRANIVQIPLHYKWSSIRFHLGLDSNNKLLDLDPAFLSLGHSQQECQERYLRFVQQDTPTEVLFRMQQSITRGLFFGDETFEDDVRRQLQLSRPKRRGRPAKIKS